MLARHPDGEAADAIRMALEDARARRDGARHYGSIRITVTAPEALEAGGTLFVFLRPAGSGGGQPLAARRILADQWPMTVAIGADDWLQPYPAAGAELVAGARYAPTPGSAVDQAGLAGQPVPLESVDGALAARVTLSEAPAQTP